MPAVAAFNGEAPITLAAEPSILGGAASAGEGATDSEALLHSRHLAATLTACAAHTLAVLDGTLRSLLLGADHLRGFLCSLALR